MTTHWWRDETVTTVKIVTVVTAFIKDITVTQRVTVTPALTVMPLMAALKSALTVTIPTRVTAMTVMSLRVTSCHFVSLHAFVSTTVFAD